MAQDAPKQLSESFSQLIPERGRQQLVVIPPAGRTIPTRQEAAGPDGSLAVLSLSTNK
jgi:hypothetical protein